MTEESWCLLAHLTDQVFMYLLHFLSHSSIQVGSVAVSLVLHDVLD
jgi:hypothetical protein